MNYEDEIFKVEDVARYLKIGKNIRVPKWCVMEYLQTQADLCYTNAEDRLPDEGRDCV